MSSLSTPARNSFTGGMRTPSWKLSVARGVEAARHVAADVEPVADRGEPAEHLAVAKDRPHQPEVVEMRAAVIGIVEQEGVAGCSVATGAASRATLSITALTAKAMAPTKIGRPVVPCTSVAPVSA